ncbi:MAG: hypothetical protein Q8J64_09445 [Thermodesulfovibrionales bacterium]|nr:hypothetical protein [Thermodesulfovibrionales bacterium]
MKILHILADGPTGTSTKIIDAQSKGNDVTVIDLSKKNVSYDAVVDAMFSNDRVVSW